MAGETPKTDEPVEQPSGEPAEPAQDAEAAEREEAAAFEEAVKSTDDSRTAPKETPETVEPDEAAATASGTEASADGGTKPKEEVPEYVQLTKKQLEDLLAGVAEYREGKTTLGKRLDDAFGQLGGINQFLASLKQSGGSVKVTAEDFPELNEEFPEMAAALAKGIGQILSRSKGGAPALTEEQIKSTAATIARSEARNQARLDRMDELEPEWEIIAGKEGESTPFRQWLAAQPADYQKVVKDTWDPKVLAKAISKFKEDTKPKAPAKPPAGKPAVNVQQNRLRAAVPVRGSGTVASGELSEEDAMEKAFNSK